MYYSPIFFVGRGEYGLFRFFAITQGIEVDARPTSVPVCLGVAIGSDAAEFGLCGAASG